MIGNDVLRWALTALLLAAALCAGLRAGRKSPPAARVGFALHAAMLVAMVPMLVPGLRWPALPQIVCFGLAAWWFVLRAVSRRPANFAGWPVPAAGPVRGGRGTLLYNALTMAAMAYMLAAMDVHGTGRAEAAGPGSAGVRDPAAHHSGAFTPRLQLQGPTQDWGSQAALVLAVAFGMAAAVHAVHVLRRSRSHNGQGLGDGFLEVVGAASMAVMFASLAA